MAKQPPRFLLRLLHWFCHPDLLRPIEGDLYELYDEVYREKGQSRANRYFLKEIISLFRHSLMKPFQKGKIFSPAGMFRNHLQVALRQLTKHKKYALINTLGLTVGIASSFLLLKYVQFFSSTDQEHARAHRLFEIAQADLSQQNNAPFNRRTFFGLGPYAKDRYPEVMMASRYITSIESRVLYRTPNGEVIKYNEHDISEADPDFIRMFSFDFILGDPQHALDEPNTVILNQSTAVRYFGDQNPLGEMLETTSPWGGQYQLTVTGVIQDQPKNSSIRFDLLKSLYKKTTEQEEDWGIPGFRTFLALDDPLKSHRLEESLSAQLSGMPQIKELNKGPYAIQLNALNRIELSSTEQLVLLTAILILIICWTNFANLFTARSLSRSREMAMRRVSGASGLNTFYQFATESLLIHLIALGGALGLVILCFPYFESITQGELLPLTQNGNGLFIFIAFILLGALLTAIYPAIITNKQQPAKVLKNYSQQSKVNGLRLPVVIQFVLSAVLIISATVISSQLNHLQSINPGYETDQTLVISPSKDLWNAKMERFQNFKHQARALAEVENVASVTSIPGRGGNGDFMTNLRGQKEKHEVVIMGVGGRFFETMGLDMVAGTTYLEHRFQKKRRSLIVNEAAVKAFGFEKTEDMIGVKIKNRSNKPDDYQEVVGVVKNFNFRSLKDEITPLLINYNPFRGHILIRLNSAVYHDSQSLNASIEKIREAWDEIYDNQVFEVQFMDQEFERQFRSEISLRKVFTVFTVISVFLSSLGLIGLSMFTTLQRKSEVGVRKVLGASVWNILQLFSRDFLKQILIAIVLSIPLAYYLMDNWLQNYTNRTGLHPLFFIIPGALLLCLGLVTIILQTLKSARSNPAQVLRNE